MLITRGQPLPDSADAADFLESGFTPAETLTWLRARLLTLDELRGAPALEAAPSAPVGEEPPPPTGEPPPDDAREADDGVPFTCLGHDHGIYYYLAMGARQVLHLTGPGHNKAGLLTLAPLTHWTQHFPAKGSVDWDSAADWLIRRSERVGVYDPMRVRGRGAWWDDGRPILHLGDHLVAAGARRDTASYPSRYIYEAAPPLRMSTENPLTSREAAQLVELCQLLPWERPLHALLLAGWCVVAPICGALQWRPHIWITGPAGSGKSWVYEHILVRCLGDIAVAAASETTEAGLRQVLGTDARPVVFDEAEGETQKAATRISNVLALMRQASTESQAAIYKGTATGEAMRFVTRSCFAFSSIGVGVQQHADRTRVTVLSLCIDLTRTAEERAARFSEVIEPRRLTLLTPQYVDRLHARTLSLVSVIRRNAETFAVAGASVIGTRRLGDQLGALLAGAYSLHSHQLITLDAATAWLRQQDWSDEAVMQEQRDEVLCLRHIMEHQVRVITENGPQDRNLAELVRRAAGHGDDKIAMDEASDTLKRHGLRVERYGDVVYIANNHTALKRILATTPWAPNWKLILRRLPGAAVSDPMWFGGGTVDRAVAVPFAAVFGDAEPTEAAVG